MRDLPSALASLVGGRASTLCRCYRLDLADGTALGFTDHDRDLAFGGVDFLAASAFDGTAISNELGLSVGEVDVDGALAALGAVSSQVIAEADIVAGRYDGAAVRIWLVDWTEVASRIVLLEGTLGEVERGGPAFRASLVSKAREFQQAKGRVFSERCDAEVGDGRCGVDLGGGFTSSGDVTEIVAGGFRTDGLGGRADGFFSGGVLTWTSGPRSGRRVRIRAHRKELSDVWLYPLLDSVPAVEVGETFTITAGCDKTFDTCRAKFANRLNFRGMVSLPDDLVLASYPVEGGSNDGGSRS
ncbi:MAG: DUF2163 domain-containing protein [Pseudomonadota bacterium]|nr:DUF2163 domain-containing protein [Pseudomonadota bacterium]